MIQQLPLNIIKKYQKHWFVRAIILKKRKFRSNQCHSRSTTMTALVLDDTLCIYDSTVGESDVGCSVRGVFGVVVVDSSLLAIYPLLVV